MIIRRTAPPKRRDKMAVHHSSEVQNWRTPKDFFKLLDARYRFTTDMAASKVNALCPKFFTEEQDSLQQDWARHAGFLNPPYKGIKHWTQRRPVRHAGSTSTLTHEHCSSCSYPPA